MIMKKEDYESVIVLNKKESERFEKSLSNPPPPNQALKDAMARCLAAKKPVKE